MVTILSDLDKLSPEELREYYIKNRRGIYSHLTEEQSEELLKRTSNTQTTESPKSFNLSRRNVDPTIKKTEPESTKKEQIQALREQSDATTAKQADRQKQIAQYQSRQNARDERIAGLGKRGNVTGLGVLGAAVDGFFTYQNERAEDPDGSKALDLAKAGLVAGAWLVAEPIMWGITIGGMVKSGAQMWIDDAQENYDIKKSAAMHVSKDESGNNKGTLGGTMIDNEYAATSRQRQEQIMRNHRIATESILGSEARQLHR